ncbi:hypothetical protein [Mumia sp. Pv 4-285]|uniref:hypothetical protein n=1 Tax=Mumia qirimensis TaxID=3234852 RepID=UPI00351D42AD
MIVGAVLALALIVAAVVVGVRMVDSDDGDSSGSSEAGSSDTDSDNGAEDGAEGGGDADAMSEDSVADLRASLDAEEAWTCYEAVPAAMSTCFYFVAGDDPQRATLRIDLADGQVTQVDLAPYLVDDPRPVTEAAARAVGDALFEGLGDDLAEAAAADAELRPDDLGAAATFTAYGDGFQIRAEGAESTPPAAPSPPKTAALAPTLTSAGFTCENSDATTIACTKNDGRTEVRALGIDHDTSSSWNVSVRGAAYDKPLDETQARTLLGQELVKLGLTDEAGATFVTAAADRQEGDFSGFRLAMGIYSPGSDAHVSAAVENIR